MFTKMQFETLFAYHWHTGTRMLDLASRLDEADYHEQTGYGQGSIHNILFHLVLHCMQHHTELAELLTRRGKSPGEIDFIYL